MRPQQYAAMKKNPYKKPPFSIDRKRRGDLARQIADGLRTAIATGFYKPGDIIPPVRDLGEILGVSMGIAVQAVSKIREEGLISPRPAQGSVVCAKDRPPWKGQVLAIVSPGVGNPLANVATDALREALTKSGYLMLSVAIPEPLPGAPSDFAILDTMLKQQTDLVVQIDARPGLSRWLSAHGVPFARLTREHGLPKGCVGDVEIDMAPANAAFAAHCREVGVKEMTLVTAWGASEMAKALREAGVRVRIQRAAQGMTRTAYTLSRWAADTFSELLAKKGKNGLPDLIFFDDDHLATGALFALSAAGVRFPDDTRLATIANRDYGPTYIQPLTRIESDNAAIGAKLAECVLAYLKTGAFPQGVVVGPKFIKGETL